MEHKVLDTNAMHTIHFVLMTAGFAATSASDHRAAADKVSTVLHSNRGSKCVSEHMPIAVVARRSSSGEDTQLFQ